MGKRKAKSNNSYKSKKPFAGWVLESPVFEEYYKLQGFVPNEEWDSFIGTLVNKIFTIIRKMNFQLLLESIVFVVLQIHCYTV